MVGGDDDQSLTRIFAIKFIGQAHRTVEFSVIVNHRGDVVGMGGAVDILRFDEGEKAAWVLVMEQANCRLSQIVD